MTKRISKLTKQIKSRKDSPARPEDVVRRQDIPAKGEMPKQLQEVGRNNYLYLQARGSKAAKPKVQLVNTGQQMSTWRIALKASVNQGRLGRFMEEVTHDALKIEVAAAPHSLESFRPPWSSLAFSPRVGAARSERLLRRRNGRAVIPHFQYGPTDDRYFIDPRSFPWFCVGRIDVSVDNVALWYGTGALVGDNVVLTASHIVPWLAGSAGLPWRMRFHPGYYGTASVVGEGFYSDVEGVRGYPAGAQGEDMAVLKLYEPWGHGLGHFGYRTYNDDWEGWPYWTVVGYPFAVGGGAFPTRQDCVTVLDDDSDGDGVELEISGDISKGNSGGPLFGWWGNDPCIIGTISGSEVNWDEDNNVAAGGDALSRLIVWARNNW